MYDQLVIIGASGHGKVIADIALSVDKYGKIVFLDDDDTLNDVIGLPVVGKACDADRFLDRAGFCIAIGNADTRKKIQTDLTEKGAEITTLIHPNAVIGRDVKIGEGTVVMAGAVINADTTVGKGCIINTCASVDHECKIGDYAHLSIGSHVAGNVNVGEMTWIGAGAVIINNVNICNTCTIGAGALVNRNIVEAGTYVGVPIRRIESKGGGVPK